MTASLARAGSAPRSPALAARRRAQSVWLAAAVALAALILLGSGAAGASAQRELRLPLDDRQVSGALVAGLHDVERDARGLYRWTDGAATALLAVPGAGRATVVTLWLGPAVPGHPPPALLVDMGGPAPAALAPAEEPRRYMLLAPPAAARAGRVALGLASDTFSVPPDPRPLAVRVEGLGARSLGGPLIWPAPLAALAQVAAVALALAAAARAGARGPWLAALGAGLAALLALALRLEPAVAPVYGMRLAVAAALLLALTAGALPLLERNPAWLGPPAEARALWGVALLACWLRLAGALFPPFSAYDLGLNLGRLFATMGGDLVATNESFEFGGGVTVYPSGPYLALMPGVLSGLTPKLAVQGGIALVDGLAALAVAALGRALGLGPRAALFGAVAYAAAPIALTTLWYGHTAQAFGQALMAPLAVALLAGLRGAPGPWPWLWAGALMAAALLSHVGVTILALAWLGLLWLALTARRTLDGRTWRRLTATLFLGGLAGLVFVYGPAVVAHLDTLASLDFGGDGVAPKPSYNLIARAFWISYTPLGLALTAAGLALARPRELPRGAGALVGAWLGAVALFWAVEMLSGLQVRYLVFLTPLACLAAGLALAWVERRGRWGPWLAWALAAALVAQGAAVWLGGVFGPEAPSMVPLLR